MEQTDDVLAFNFWPSFADSMLAVVFILIVVLVFVAQQGLAGFATIRASQSSVVRSIARSYQAEIDTVQEGVTRTVYSIRKDGTQQLQIDQDVQLQRIMFQGNVLFAPNDYQLTGRGREVLRFVGEAIRSELGRIAQLQIEGHTDLYPTDRYAGGNLELGARRARSVLRFLERDVGIDPARHLMSATSYGPFRPVGRDPGEAYDEDQLWEANNEADERRRNRRIELLLV